MFEFIGIVVVALLVYLGWRMHVLHITLTDLKNDWTQLKSTGKPFTPTGADKP